MRVVLITGANRGLGRKAAERLLLETSDLKVILTARRAEEGAKALSEIQALGDFSTRAVFHPLDVGSADSVAQLREYIRSTVGQLDVLVNNAAVYFVGQTTPEVARTTIATNFTATVDLTEALLPVIKPGGHIVMVSSRYGQLRHIPGEPIRARLTDPGLTVDTIRAMASEYVASADEGSRESKGWPMDAYIAAKNLLNAYVRVRAPQLQQQPEHLRMNALCPGWVRTDMGGASAPLSIQEGTETHLQVIRDTSTGTGEFWYEGKVGDWQ